MIKGDTALDMRGRCSAGQKVCLFAYCFWRAQYLSIGGLNRKLKTPRNIGFVHFFYGSEILNTLNFQSRRQLAAIVHRTIALEPFFLFSLYLKCACVIFSTFFFWYTVNLAALENWRNGKLPNLVKFWCSLSPWNAFVLSLFYSSLELRNRNSVRRMGSDLWLSEGYRIVFCWYSIFNQRPLGKISLNFVFYLLQTLS